MSAALVDQGMIAVAGLALNFGLARILLPEAYGSFAIGFTVLVFMVGIHSALIAEPMSVLGRIRYVERIPEYLRTTLQIHGALSLLFTLLSAALAVALLALSRSTAIVFAGIAIAAVPHLLHAMARRVAYLEHRPGRALVASASYTIALLIGGAFLISMAALTPFTAYLLIAGSSLLGSVPFIWRMARLTASDTAPRDVILRENWDYSRWILAAGLAHWLGIGLIVPALGILSGLEEAGVFRALLNFVAPINQLITAATLLMLPRLASRAAATTREAPWRDLLLLGRFTAPLTVVYLVALMLWGGDLLDSIYDQPVYSDHSELLTGFALYAIVLCTSHALAVALRAREDTNSVFLSKSAGLAAAWLLGFPLMYVMGVAGAVIALNIAALAELATLTIRFPWRHAGN